MHTVIRCSDCRDERGRPKIFRQSCPDCEADFIAPHMADYPAHRLEMSGGHVEDIPRRESRATQQLIGRRAGGW